MPSWKKHVSRPVGIRPDPFDAILRQGALKGTWLKQTWFLQLWRQNGADIEVVNRITYRIVWFGVVATATAQKIAPGKGAARCGIHVAPRSGE